MARARRRITVAGDRDPAQPGSAIAVTPMFTSDRSRSTAGAVLGWLTGLGIAGGAVAGCQFRGRTDPTRAGPTWWELVFCHPSGVVRPLVVAWAAWQVTDGRK